MVDSKNLSLHVWNVNIHLSRTIKNSMKSSLNLTFTVNCNCSFGIFCYCQEPPGFFLKNRFVSIHTIVQVPRFTYLYKSKHKKNTLCNGNFCRELAKDIKAVHYTYKNMHCSIIQSCHYENTHFPTTFPKLMKTISQKTVTKNTYLSSCT